MLLDAKHKPWVAVVTALTVAGAAGYVPYHVLSLHGPSGVDLETRVTWMAKRSLQPADFEPNLSSILRVYPAPGSSTAIRTSLVDPPNEK